MMLILKNNLAGKICNIILVVEYRERDWNNRKFQICPRLNANETQIPYDKHHNVSSLVTSHRKHTQF